MGCVGIPSVEDVGDEEVRQVNKQRRCGSCQQNNSVAGVGPSCYRMCMVVYSCSVSEKWGIGILSE